VSQTTELDMTSSTLVKKHVVGLPEPIERLLILKKRKGIAWEANAVANPGITRLDDGTLAVVYRAAGKHNDNYLGFCRLDTEGRVVIRGSRRRKPLYQQSQKDIQEFPEGYADPRINKIGEWYYIWAHGRNNEILNKNRALYDNDFDKQYIGGRQTVAFRTKDFKTVEYLGLYGPREFDKNAFLHPEQVMANGMPHFALFHRIQYSIQLALARTIEEFGRASFWKREMQTLETSTIALPLFAWEGVSLQDNWPGSIAGGTPAIEIESGLLGGRAHPNTKYWLTFYNASGEPRSGQIAQGRQIGAFLYATNTVSNTHQPFTVIARPPHPVLSPKETYEMNARNGDIVFATGAVRTQDGTGIDLFYGSGDWMISKARFNLSKLIAHISQYDAIGNLLP
jgi:predicted GH43/DUF377 family glycosyl hydrolase